MENIFGYFNHPESNIPEYDPGLDVYCPVCNKKLKLPVVTISLMAENDIRSYFYRIHKHCSEIITPEQETNIDSIIIDAIYKGRETN